MTGQPPGAPGEEDMRRALRADADRAAAADSDAVWQRISQGVHRRRRRRELVGTAASALAVLAIAVGSDQFGGAIGTAEQAGPAASAASTSSARPAATQPPTSSKVPTQDSPGIAGTARPDSSSARAVPLVDQDIPTTPEDARRAFTDAGYDEDDARQLGEVWRWGQVQDVEVVAGARLTRGEQLPLQPGEDADDATADTTWPLFENLLSYTTAGYDNEDAEVLAARWGEEPPLVRMLVGELTRAGELPADSDLGSW